MHLTYTLQQADISMARDIATEALTPLLKRRVLLAVLNGAVWAFGAVAFVAILELINLGRGFGSHLAMALSGFAGLVAYVALQRVWFGAHEMAALQAMGPYPIRQALSVGADGICVSDEISEARWAWEAVQDVREDPKHVAIIVKGSAVILVPEAAFTSQEARTAFVATIREHVSTPKLNTAKRSLG